LTIAGIIESIPIGETPKVQKIRKLDRLMGMAFEVIFFGDNNDFRFGFGETGLYSWLI
jgi:hypothetical protein